MRLENVTRGTEEEIQAVVKNEAMSKSGKIKELFNLGLDVKEISNTTGIIYNMCYNVLTNYVLTQGINVVKEKKASKKDVIFEMLSKGMTNMDIARDTRTNYNYVCKLKKEWRIQNVDAKEVVIELVEPKTVTVHPEVAATVEVEAPAVVEEKKEEQKLEVPEEVLAEGVTKLANGQYTLNGKFIGKKDPRHPEYKPEEAKKAEHPLFTKEDKKNRK